MEPMFYRVRKAVPFEPTNKSDDVPHCYHSTQSFAPTTKRPRFSSPSSSDLKGKLGDGTFSLNTHHASSEGPGGSSRINNIRIVSDASIHVGYDSRTRTNGKSNCSLMANSMCSYDGSAIKKLPDQLTLDSDLLAAKIVSVSHSSSVASPECIRAALQSLRCIIGSDMQSQLNISDQCSHLAAWTHISTAYCSGNESRPTSTSASLTLHQVALAIVSYGGIPLVLNAMGAHPSNVEIQENGCKVLGNMLAILYRRKTGKVFSYEKFPDVKKELGPEMKSTGEAIRFIKDLRDPYFRQLYKERSMHLSK